MKEAIERASANNAIRQKRLDEYQGRFSDPGAKFISGIFGGIEQGRIDAETQRLQPLMQESGKQQRSQMAQDIEAVTGQKLNPDNFDTSTMQELYTKTLESKVAPKTSDIPSAIREYNFFQKLSPEERRNYINIKRADPIRAKGLVETSEGVAPIQGFAGGRQEITQAEEAGKQSAKLQYEPTIAGNKTAAKSNAEFKAKAQQNLPQALSNANYMTSLLDELTKHPGMPGMVGLKGARTGFVGYATPGTPEAGFAARLKQIEGGAFLEAFESLRHGGAISNTEGEKATQAKARMSTAQSEKEFVEAAKEYKSIINKGISRARAAAIPNADNRDIIMKAEEPLVPYLPEESGKIDYKSKYGLE